MHYKIFSNIIQKTSVIHTELSEIFIYKQLFPFKLPIYYIEYSVLTTFFVYYYLLISTSKNIVRIRNDTNQFEMCFFRICNRILFFEYI